MVFRTSGRFTAWEKEKNLLMDFKIILYQSIFFVFYLKKISNLLVHFLNDCKNEGKVRPQLGSIQQVSHVGSWDPGIGDQSQLPPSICFSRKLEPQAEARTLSILTPQANCLPCSMNFLRSLLVKCQVNHKTRERNAKFRDAGQKQHGIDF